MSRELEFLRRIRRSVHRRPELGHAETRTAALIERLLLVFGLTPFRPAPTSVAVVVGPPGAKPVVGFRADIDALPITERNAVPYASREPGVMHACGHDGHIAVLLALARRLAATPPLLPVLLVFQQAEESYPSGAPQVVDDLRARGLLPAECYAFHLWPELPAGTIGVRAGPVLAAVTGLVITVSGSGGREHGTRCEVDAVDALGVGVQVYGAVCAISTGRHPTARQPSTVTVGQLVGGTAPNKVPIMCELLGTVRSMSLADEQAALRAIDERTREIAARTGARIEIAVRSGIRPLVANHPDAVARVRAACLATGAVCLDYPQSMVGVSDDFGWFLAEMAGAYAFLGCRTGDRMIDLHRPDFDFDESALVPAVAVADQVVRTAVAAGMNGHRTLVGHCVRWPRPDILLTLESGQLTGDNVRSV